MLEREFTARNSRVKHCIMRTLYAVGFGFSLLGIFGVGHLLAGLPRRGAIYFAIGLIWFVLAGVVGIMIADARVWLFPVHLLLVHLCAADAVRGLRRIS